MTDNRTDVMDIMMDCYHDHSLYLYYYLQVYVYHMYIHHDYVVVVSAGGSWKDTELLSCKQGNVEPKITK